MPDQARAFGAHPMIVPTIKSRSFSTVSPASLLNSRTAARTRDRKFPSAARKDLHRLIR